MRLLQILLLVFLPTAVAQPNCGRLSQNDTYEKLNQILECLESKILDTKKEAVIPSQSMPTDTVSSEQPVGEEEAEDNNIATKANLIAMGQRVHGKITTRDRDFYKFSTSRQTEKFRVIVRKINGFRAVVKIYNAFENKIGGFSPGAFAPIDEPVSVAVESSPDSFYYISVAGFDERDSGEYELEVREEN